MARYSSHCKVKGSQIKYDIKVTYWDWGEVIATKVHNLV